MWQRCNYMQSFLDRFSLVVTLLLVGAGLAHADVCVWRNPERAMTRLFPQAADYTTLTVKLTAGRVAVIEQMLGSPLDPSETHEMNFYRITDRAGAHLGTVMALAGKGKYGAIEVVTGIDPQHRIVGAYIQQSRERVTQAISSPAFLGQFVGKSAHDSLTPGRDLSPPSGTEQASAVVAATIRKMLLFHRVLIQKEGAQ